VTTEIESIFTLHRISHCLLFLGIEGLRRKIELDMTEKNPILKKKKLSAIPFAVSGYILKNAFQRFFI
jgi:hypothetical protein